MLAIQFPKPNQYRLTDIAVPKIGPGELLICVKSTTICATDFKIFHGTFPGVKYPHIPGHEWGGEIVEIGPGVRGFSIGDKIGVEVHVGCGSCLRCLEGYYNLCENYANTETGHAHIGFTVPGGLAEYCAIPAKAAHKLPLNLDYDHGAFTDTVGIVLWAFERAGGVQAGESVAIVGPGTLGLLSVQIARAQGASLVIAIGTPADTDRLAQALSMGADYVINLTEGLNPVQTVRELTNGLGVDLVIEFAGSAEAAKTSIEITRRGGRVVLGGATGPGKRLDVDLSTIVRGHLSVLGSVANPRGISDRANKLMAKGLVDIRPLITHHFSLTDFPHAWAMFENRQDGIIRPMMHPGE